MPGAADAIKLATAVSEVGFSNFTSHLVREVFEALLDAHVLQMNAYTSLIERSAVALKDFLASGKDEVSEEEVDSFLTQSGLEIEFQDGASLTAPQVERLNARLATQPEAGVAADNKVASEGPLTAAEVTAIRKAAAIRIAQRNYTVLQETVRTGLMRLVVDSGVIETKMTFRTYGKSQSSKKEKVQSLGGVLAGTPQYRHPYETVSLAVSTATTQHRDTVGSSVNIFGRVEIHFKTDYVPLAR
jgi:hypothetical protein